MERLSCVPRLQRRMQTLERRVHGQQAKVQRDRRHDALAGVVVGRREHKRLC